VNEILSYPHYSNSQPRFYYAKNKKPGSAVVVFVHFYGGHQRILKRHIQMVNDFGFDAFAFNMPSRKDLNIKLFEINRFGLKHLYSKMITYFLDQIPGQKIIFSFSNPSASAIEAITDRLNRNDIQAFICDSGPSGKFMKSAWNLAIQQQQNPWLMVFFSFFWSLFFHRDLKKQLKKWPEGFPVLSIRPLDDVVIPPDHIEEVFKGTSHLRIQVYLPKAGHLNALKLNPIEYTAQIENFLSTI